MNPFEISGLVSTTTADHWDEIGEKDYVPFMINRGLSYHIDTIMLVQELNRRHTMPREWQYDFLRLAIFPKKKRFSKWAKPEEDQLIDTISEAYQVNRQRAIGIRALLDNDAVAVLREKTERGGR